LNPRAHGDTRLLAESEVWRGCALNQLGDWEEGRSVQETAIPLCEAAGDLSSLSHALNDVAFAHESTGRFGRSRFYKLRALEVAERFGDPAGIANIAFRCGQLAFLQGDWDEARGHYLRALELLQQVGSSSIAPYPHFGLARLALVRAQLAEARAEAESCLALARESADRQAIQAATGALAECDLLAGEAVQARDRLLAVEPSEEGLALYGVAPIMAEACLRAGDLPAARAWADRSVTRARNSHHQVDLVDALRVQALVLSETDSATALAALPPRDCSTPPAPNDAYAIMPRAEIT
jgi:ATP/maltotriose-dependent transcriptional regulator MalT